MKTAVVIGFLAFSAAVFGGFVYLAKNFQVSTEAIKVNPDTFKLSNDRIVSDLQNRFIVIPPVGQAWGFAPDQKITIDVLQTRGAEEGVVVAVKLTANAIIQPATPTPSATSGNAIGNAAPTPNSPVSVTLSGVAKLHYEFIAGEWYLSDIISVNMHATQK